MSDSRTTLGIAAVVLGLSVVGYRWWSSSRADPARAPTGSDPAPNSAGNVVPAAMADSAEALQLGISIAPGERGRRLTLTAGGGKAILTLLAPEPKGDAFAFGRCSLEADDRQSGAAFVSAVARWLQVTVGAPGAENPLAPMPCTYAVLGDGKDPSGRSWLVRKLFFETRGDTPEVFLRVSADEKQAELLEKDSDYREPLIAALGRALREGPTPRRTMATDPNLASDAPLVASVKPLPGGSEADSPTWAGERLLAVKRAGNASVVLLWDALDQQPRDVAHLEGSARNLVLDPTAKKLAVVTLFPDERGSISSASPGSASIIDLADGKETVLHARDATPPVGMFATPVWSPDGARVALGSEGDAADAAAPGAVTLVYDVASGKRVDATKPELDARPERWTRDGLRLEHSSFDPQDRQTKRSYWRWEPGKAAPGSADGAEAPPSEARSPDGRFGVRLRDKGLLVTGEGGARRFTSARVEDQDAMEGLESGATWIGGAGLVLLADDPLLLDLATLKLRLLLPPGAPSRDPSSNGKVVLVRGDDHSLHWGSLEP